MPINQAALQRLRDSQMRGGGVATIFEHLAFGFEQLGAAASQVQIDYQDPADTVVEGDLIPVITLALRPATLQP